MKITVITVAFNSASTIADTIRSVKNQTYTDYEHLIVDGGSSDVTMSMVEDLQHAHLAFISEPDDGIYDAMNKGIRRASGDVIGILNSDDFYANGNVLSDVSQYFLQNPRLDVLLGDVDFVSSDNLLRPVRTYRANGFQPWMFRIGLMPPHPAVFVRKAAYERVGNYKIGYNIAADFDFLVRLLAVDRANYLATGKHWVRMRTGGISTASWRSNVLITQEMLRSLRENNIFSCVPMLLIRLPVKFIRQVL